MRLSRVISNSVALVSLDILNKALPLVVFPIVVRALGPAVYGELGFAGAVAGFFALLASQGFGTYAIREAAKDSERISFLVRHVVGARIAFASGSYLLLTIYTAWLAPHGRMIRLLILLSGLSFAIGSIDIQWLYTARSRMWVIAARGLISQLAYAGIILLYVHSPSDVWIIPTAAAVGLLITTVLLWISARREYTIPCPQISFTTWSAFVPTCMVLGFASLMSMLYDQIDTVMLKYFRTDTEVGLYVACYSLMAASLSFLPIAGQVFAPLFSETAGQNSHDERKYLRWAAYATVGMAMPITAGGFILATPLTGLILGKQYDGSGFLFRWLMLCILTTPFASYYGGRLIAHHRENQYLISVGSGALINIVLNLYFIPRYGAIAAALTTAISQATVAIMNYFFTRDLWQPNLLPPVTLSMAASAVMVAGLLSLRAAYSIPVVALIVFGALLYCVTFALAFKIWNRSSSV